jgi:hypothetical protein
MDTDAQTKATSKQSKYPPSRLRGLKPCKPGETHNPQGRPKKENCPADIARQILESKSIDLTITFPDGKKKNLSLTSDQSLLYAGLSAVMRKGLAGDVQALKEILDRGYGKVLDKLQVESDGKVNITFSEVPIAAQEPPK